MAGYVGQAEDSRPEDYRIYFDGDIRSKSGLWTEEQSRSVQAAFTAFLEEQGARFVHKQRMYLITPRMNQ